jgi:hypothetical protein
MFVLFSIVTRNLFNGERQRGYVNNNQWNYYSYRSNTIDSFVVQLTHGDGDCDLYINNVCLSLSL